MFCRDVMLTFYSSSTNLINVISADLISACGRIKNTAKVRKPALVEAGFFVPELND